MFLQFCTVVMFIVLDAVSTKNLHATAPRVDTELSPCYNRSCYPHWGNLLKGRKVFANSTCGSNGSEEYCLVSNERKEIMCDTCDSSDPRKRHPPSFLKDRRIKSRSTWWKAVNGEEHVTLQLDLETTFQFTHLIMVFYSFRPAAMVIERSTDHGKTWMPYQYFAYDCQNVFGMRERELGEPDEYGIKRHPDEDVICTSKYSKLEPAQGGEVIYKVIRGRPTTNANRPSLRKLLLLTNLRVRFVKLHTLGDDKLDPKSIKKYFYAVEDWVVRGSCFCNGHSDHCTPMPGVEAVISEYVKNMINGSCECRHNTAGHNCERCKDFYHKLPWLPGDPSTGQSHACEACNCNGHSDSCVFDELLYVQTGDGGRCTKCQHSTAGPHCDMCVYGYYQRNNRKLSDSDICQPCNCNEAGTTVQICASVTTSTVTAGTCICKDNVLQSAKCDTCKPDHFNLDAENPLGCSACGCDTRGTVDSSTSCNDNGQCSCKDNVDGLACDRCKEGYFNMRAGSEVGCETCQCDTVGSRDTDKCDPITGACYCKEGFTGYFCTDMLPGYFIPSMDHWKYNPEDSGIIDGEGHTERTEKSNGTGYIVLPVDSSVTQSIDEKTGEEEDLENLDMSLETGYYDLKIYHEPADSDYTLVLELDHTGKFDGTKPSAYDCGLDKDLHTEQPFSKQTITIKINTGSSVTRIEDLCMEQGSQYNIKLMLGEEGTGSMVIRDMKIVKPTEPEKAFALNPLLEELYREYQDLGCPMVESQHTDINNECYRLKKQIEGSLTPGSEPCKVTLCLPDLDVWNFSNDKIDSSVEKGAQIVVEEGGKIRLPSDSSMTVLLNPGTGGLRELVLSHDVINNNVDIAVDITVTHKGNADGTNPMSYRCGNKIIRPYSENRFSIVIPKDTKFTSIGNLCLDPKGEYIVKLSPKSNNDGVLVVNEIFLTPSDFGKLVYPDSEELADLWDNYIAADCPKFPGGKNSDKKECVQIYNQIMETEDKLDHKKDCSKDSCIPYNLVWRPEHAIDDLSEGSYIDPEDGQVVIPRPGAAVELPVSGSDTITGSLVDLVMKHDPVSTEQTLTVQLVRTDSDGPYSCGILENVPKTQRLEVKIQPGTEHTLLSTFCIVPDGEYELRIVGKDVEEHIKISEIGSVLPSDSNAAYPDNDEAAEQFQKYINAGCKVYPTKDASKECKHLANLVDYHSDPARKDHYTDCDIELCYPTNDVYNAGEGNGIVLAGGALVDKTDGSVVVPGGGKVQFKLDPIITGPNAVVIEYDSKNPPDDIIVDIKYKGTKDSSKIEEFQCQGKVVKPGNSEHQISIESSKIRVEFEECMVYDGLYQLEISVVEDDKSININKVYVELPRNSSKLFGDDDEAEELLDDLLTKCVNKEFTAECADISRQLQSLIDDNHDAYKVDCAKELCLPEGTIWTEGDEFGGSGSGTANGGYAVLPKGDTSMTLKFDGSKTPKEGLNSIILTTDPADYRRVVDIILLPKDPKKDGDYVTCGDVSSSKEQLLRKVIQAAVVFVEIGPVCIDQDLEYEVQINYKGVQPPNSDRIYPQTGGISIVVHSIDVVLPTSPEEAYPDNKQAADIWEQYVKLQCPRLKAGYRDASEECHELLEDLRNVVNNVQEMECTISVCIDTDGGWIHDPTSDKEVFEDGAAVSGASKDAVIVLPPGGEVNIKTGEKETAIPAENIPRTGLMDVLIGHEKSNYGWYLKVEVTHTKTKGNVIPAEYSCGADITIQPYATQEFKVKVAGCTTQTRIPGVCVSKDNTYSITVSVIQQLEEVKEKCTGVVESSGFPLDDVMFTFPEDPDVAFPDSPKLQEIYREYLNNSCPGVRSKVCDALTVAIIADLVGQSVISPSGCDCDTRGSLSNKCDNVGGQCPCRSGYTGRQCNICKPGFFGIQTLDVCKPCNCNTYGSISNVCDEKGQCSCYQGVATADILPGLNDCSQCLPGFVGLGNMDMQGCVKCECGRGASLPNCDETSGMCTCHPGVAQPLCNDCSPGFYDLQEGQGCKSCDCDRAGSDGIECGNTNGTCTCKSNVVGAKCDSCATGSYALSEENPDGCTSCYCHGITDDCTTAKGWSVGDAPLRDIKWTVLGGHQERRKKYVIGAVKGTEMVWRAEKLGNFYHSYSLSLKVQLTGIENEEILLRLYRGKDMFITAQLTKQADKLLQTQLYEFNFESDSKPVSYDLFRYILSDITQLEITTLYNEYKRHDQKIKSFVIERSEKGVAGKAATNVEKCLCPAGYAGPTCGSCVKGFAKNFTTQADKSVSFECVECNRLCNGHTGKCDKETGQCYNCSDHTAGLHCDQCDEGYYPIIENNRTVCTVCPCSKNAVSLSCSLGDAGDYPVCDNCEKGYFGPNCTDCSPGYWGKEGSCTACECNGNIDVSDEYSCDKVNGVCQLCLYNTTGNECESCLPGFYGNAKKVDLPKCRACNCDSMGSKSEICDNFSGLCDCHSHVTGTRCNRCAAGYWNLTQGVGCETCDCDRRGSVGTECDSVTGQCRCKEGIEGRKCNTCLPGYYNVNADNHTQIVCSECSCNADGATSQQCASDGQCPCKDGIIGLHCDQCARGTTGVFPECEPCGECYSQYEKEVMVLEGEIQGLAAKAQNIHLGAANLTEDELQDIFRDMKRTLKDAEKLANSSPGDTGKIKKMTETLSAMSSALQKKSKELDLLETKLNAVDKDTTDTIDDLSELDKELEDFKIATNNLAEKAMNLSAANLDEALKLVEDAAMKSSDAKQRAAATKDDIERAQNRAKKAEAIMNDPIFSDSTSVERLAEIDEDLKDLSEKLDKVDGKVCGSDSDDCDKCGGSECGSCGGAGCGGAVGIISSITQLAADARQCADERQSQVTDATSDLRELTNQADESQESVNKMLSVSKQTHKNLTKLETQLKDAKTKINKFLGDERVTAQEIEQIIQATADLKLPLSEDELSKLIDDLSSALSEINRVDTEVDISLPDKQRVADLLARAESASQNANSTLEGILKATAALREFDENYSAAEQSFKDTSDVVNKAWSGITQMNKNTEEAEKSRAGVDKDLEDLEKELKLLLTEIQNGDAIADLAQKEIDATDSKVKSNSDEVQRLKKDYDILDKDISEKEDLIQSQLEKTKKGGKLSDDVEESITMRVEEVEQLTEKYITQQSTLVDLNSQLDDLETKLDKLMEQINEKAVFHAVCNTDVPAR